MGAIKVFLKEVLLPIALAFCLASFLKPIYMPDGVCDYFLMWICVGLPFGIRRMCLWLVPSGYGISGSVGIFVLNLIIPIPPSSAGKPLPWCRSFASTAADPRKAASSAPFRAYSTVPTAGRSCIAVSQAAASGSRRISSAPPTVRTPRSVPPIISVRECFLRRTRRRKKRISSFSRLPRRELCETF